MALKKEDQKCYMYLIYNIWAASQLQLPHSLSMNYLFLLPYSHLLESSFHRAAACPRSVGL